MFFQILTLLSLVSAAFASHRIDIHNNCGHGTPTMYGPRSLPVFKNGPVNIAKGHTAPGNLNGFIIYLQNGGQCGANGDNCLTVEGSLNHGFSSVDISKIAPHKFNKPIAFTYHNGAGSRRCGSSNCICNHDAFCKTDDYGAQIGTSDVNAGITVTFC